MKKDNNIQFSDNDFIKNQRKRRNPDKLNKIAKSNESNKVNRSNSSNISAESNKNKRKRHDTAIIVSSVLLTLSTVFVCLLLFYAYL